MTIRQTKKNYTVKIGISLGSHSIGLACKYHNEIVDLRIKRFVGAWSQEKHTRILDAISVYIACCCGQKLFVYIPYGISEELLSFLQVLTLKYPSLQTFSIKDIELYYPAFRNKEAFFNHLGSIHPELFPFVYKPSKQKLFEAVWVTSL